MPQQPDQSQSPGEALVAQGAMVIQIENAEMRSFALANRRNEAGVKTLALEILRADPDAAASAYYSIPYKNHTRSGDCTGLSDDNCPVESEVEGIGIDGARDLARLWGNNASRVYFTEEDVDWCRMAGVFVDLETNTRVEVPYAVPKFGTDRGGNAYVLKPGRLAMAVQAGVSKCARNAIVQGLPKHLSRAYYETAKELVLGSGAVDVPKLVEAFATFNVTRERLESFYGGKLEELEPEKRRQLRGLFVAIRENLVQPDAFFAGAGGASSAPDEPADEAATSGRTEGVSASPVPGATAAVEPSPHRAPAPAAGSRTQAEWDADAAEANATAAVTATGPEAEEPEPEPTPEPSQPTLTPVSSAKPNDTAEPSQAAFDDLGI